MSNPFFDEAGPQPPKVLTAPLEIQANLKQLLDNNVSVSIRFLERNQRYQSYLIDLHRDRGWLAFDELIPSDGDRLMMASEPFEAEAFYEGARLSWKNHQTVHPADYDGARCYWTPLPDELTYHQRRNAYRARLDSIPITATLGGAPLSRTLTGRLLDLSATGCKMSFKGNVETGLQTGQVYPDFCAELPSGPAKCAVELRHVSYDERRDATFCGMRFYQMSGLLQRQIERFVYQLQREARRHSDAPFA